ncbi:hypothetical protein FNF29_00591 [Cafeteria roenbergensis]|uniref:Sec16 Sec23-binding domain-containing protein n=1 Tax=Cafeteria roenbergensis TaxID=33653 RepID=A0A5A8CX45_CAFRO|nr:hypothetical protein FNF29_00591 [Cafeteria roenbergensis]|eukprot:KAA0157239.1 hypothetical protein FNF29_00591 [Cafeteria roenbergensis]
MPWAGLESAAKAAPHELRPRCALASFGFGGRLVVVAPPLADDCARAACFVTAKDDPWAAMATSTAGAYGGGDPWAASASSAEAMAGADAFGLAAESAGAGAAGADPWGSPAAGSLPGGPGASGAASGQSRGEPRQLPRPAHQPDRVAEGSRVPPACLVDLAVALRADARVAAMHSFPGPLHDQDDGAVVSWLQAAAEDALSAEAADAVSPEAGAGSALAGRKLLHGVLAARLLRGGAFNALEGDGADLAAVCSAEAELRAGSMAQLGRGGCGSDLSAAQALLRAAGAAAAGAGALPVAPPAVDSDAVAVARAEASDGLESGDVAAASMALARGGDWARAFALAAAAGPAASSAVAALFAQSALSPSDPAGLLLRTALKASASSTAADRPPSQAAGAGVSRAWHAQVRALIAARPAEARPALLELAGGVWREWGDAASAQAILLLAGAGLQLDHPEARLVLLGANHVAQRRAFRRDVRSWQLTEAFEAAGRRHQGEEARLSLHPYRLLYALSLADHGLRREALAYALDCRSSVVLETARAAGRLPLHPAFVATLDEFVHRIAAVCDHKLEHASVMLAARALAASGRMTFDDGDDDARGKSLSLPTKASDAAGQEAPASHRRSSEGSGSMTSVFGIGMLSTGLNGIRSMFLPKNASLINFDAEPDDEADEEEERREAEKRAAAAVPPPIIPASGHSRPAQVTPAAGPPGPAPPAASDSPHVPPAPAAPAPGGASAAPGPPTSSRGRRSKRAVVSRYVNTFSGAGPGAGAPSGAPLPPRPAGNPKAVFNPASMG